MWPLILPQSLTLSRTLMSPDGRCLTYEKGNTATDFTCMVMQNELTLGKFFANVKINYKGLSSLFLLFVFSGPQFPPS